MAVDVLAHEEPKRDRDVTTTRTTAGGCGSWPRGSTTPWSTARSSSRRGRTRGATPAACCATPGITALTTVGASRRPRHAKEETAKRHADGSPLPGFVEQEFRDFLTCGVLAHGFARLRCTDCAFERLLPFSCKGRGFYRGGETLDVLLSLHLDSRRNSAGRTAAGEVEEQVTAMDRAERVAFHRSAGASIYRNDAAASAKVIAHAATPVDRSAFSKPTQSGTVRHHRTPATKNTG